MANSSFRTSPMEFLRSVEVVFARSQLPRPRHRQQELCAKRVGMVGGCSAGDRPTQSPSRYAGSPPSSSRMSTRKTARALKTTPGRKQAVNRDLIDTGTDNRDHAAEPEGQFKESDDFGRSLSADHRVRANTKATRGQGDKGDR